MFKFTEAVLVAAVIAGVFTFLSPISRLDAGPLPEKAEAALKTCSERPWPYVNCVGTPFGDPRIRVIETDKL